MNADSTALPRGPMMRSMWATSLPSPTSDSPTSTLLIFAMTTSPFAIDAVHPVETLPLSHPRHGAGRGARNRLLQSLRRARNSVATVRSALVPGLSPRAFSSPVPRGERASRGRRVGRSRRFALARNRLVPEPRRLPQTELPRDVRVRVAGEEGEVHLASSPIASRARARAPRRGARARYRSRRRSRSRTAGRSGRGRRPRASPRAGSRAPARARRGDRPCRARRAAPAGCASNASLASSMVRLARPARKRCMSASRPGGPDAACASGAASSTMPRLVFVPTAWCVATIAPVDPFAHARPRVGRSPAPPLPRCGRSPPRCRP